MAKRRLQAKREATVEELKAMAHPLRMRIIRLCGDEALTNREIAGRLGRDPATVLHHVRTLVDAGFLAPQPVRTGTRGALEKPYRSTGLSWELSIDEPPDAGLAEQVEMASLDAYRAEMEEAGHAALRGQTRTPMRLGPESLAELQDRIWELVTDFTARDEPDGERLSFFWSLHRRPDA